MDRNDTVVIFDIGMPIFIFYFSGKSFILFQDGTIAHHGQVVSEDMRQFLQVYFLVDRRFDFFSLFLLPLTLVSVGSTETSERCGHWRISTSPDL